MLHRESSFRFASASLPRPRPAAAWPLWLLLCVWVAGSGGAQAQEKFRQRNYRVRIAVVDDVEHLVIRGNGTYQVHAADGTPLRLLPAGQPYEVEITRGRPGERLYRLVLAQMEPHQTQEAIDRARAAKERYGLPVKVLRIPAKLPEESRVLVALGEFATVEGARAYAPKLRAERIEYIYEDRARAKEGQVRLTAEDGTIAARDETLLRIVPLNLRDNSLSVLSPEGEEWSGSDLDRARHYRGEIELTINEDGTLTAVNDLWVEFYLYSVTATELGPEAPVESLKAQAVAARSVAVARIQRGIVSGSFFDFYDTQQTQAYKGKGIESEGSRRAVDETRGEILVWEGKPADAVYCRCCGGVLASARDVWGSEGEEYLTRRMDRLRNRAAPNLSSFEQAHKWTASTHDALCAPGHEHSAWGSKTFYRWTKVLDRRELNEACSRFGTGTVRNVAVMERTPSGRVRELKIEGAKQTVRLTNEFKIRRALGDIYSTFFTMVKLRDEAGNFAGVKIHGGGSGHGVGMCQLGAIAMGRQGYNYRQILAQYYTDVQMRRLYQ